MWYKAKKDMKYIENDAKYAAEAKGIKAEEIGRMFQDRVEKEMPNFEMLLEQKGIKTENVCFSQLKSKLSIQQIVELAENFFETILPELTVRIRDIINGKIKNTTIEMSENKELSNAECLKMNIPKTDFNFPEDMIEEIKNKDPELYQRFLELSEDRTITKIMVSCTGTLNDLYNFIHELTHYYANSNKTYTERLLDEVAPQCMERLLDDFLLKLTDAELAKYNITKKDLIDDINVRRLETFVSRYKTVKTFNGEVKKEKTNEGIKEENLQYVLAQIYQTQFLKFNIKDRKVKIREFLDHVKNNDFEGANRTLGIDWGNELKRRNYIDITVNEAKRMIEVQNKAAESTSDKTLCVLEGDAR